MVLKKEGEGGAEWGGREKRRSSGRSKGDSDVLLVVVVEDDYLLKSHVNFYIINCKKKKN